MQKYVSCFSLFGSSVTNAPVVGNGITLGFTNGAVNGGLCCDTATINNRYFEPSFYGASVSESTSGNNGPYIYGHIGVTPDPTKSGLITKFSGLTLGTVTSKKLGNFYIRYQKYKV